MFSPRSPHALFALAALHTISGAFAQSLTPLASKSFAFNALPTHAAGDVPGPRGNQFGFNNCNASTAGDNSNCQTLVVNSITDFCLYGVPDGPDTIANTEAKEVAYCLNPERGGRPIPPGAIKGAQLLYAEHYIQLAMVVDQTRFGLTPDDQGGELDPHGDDEQGNPIGAQVFSNSFSHQDNAAKFNERFKSGILSTSDSEEDIHEWLMFIGGNTTCFKGCINSDPNAPQLCNHIYDEIGCAYNAIADYDQIPGTFTVCDSTDMDPPGVYTGTDGKVSSWVQPWSGEWTVPYQPTQVTSSNCFTYQSTDLFPVVSATPTGTAKGLNATPTGSSGGGSGAAAGSSRLGSANGPVPTAGSGANAAVSVVVGPLTILVGAMLGAFITVFS